SGGSRTIGALLENHIHVLASNTYEFIFGTSQYVYRGNSDVSSDVGWIILFNHSGLMSIVLVVTLLVYMIHKAFGYSVLAFSWTAAAIWLNFKGLIVGPNALIFLLTLLALLTRAERYSPGNGARISEK